MTTKANIETLKNFVAADFWCGAGGTSEGLKQAAIELGYKVNLTAVNHWTIAVATHSANHPDARHYCKAVDTLKPLELFPDRRLDLLLASPECTHHSNARGGKPRDEQSRADANDIKRWVEKLYIKAILIENVKEFVEWGPLGEDGQPIEKLKGKYFLSFIKFLKLTHHVEWRMINCADHGDATTRERFFLQAVRKELKLKIDWPEPSHMARAVLEQLGATSQQTLFNNPKTMKAWKPARDIIDWSMKGHSVFLTAEDCKEQKLPCKRPLSDNTMRRIVAGLFKYSLKPFLVNAKNAERRDRNIDEPTFTQTSGGNHQYLIDLEPFLVQHFGEREGQEPRVKNLDEPLWTVTAQGRMGMAEPFICSIANTGEAAKEKNGARVYEIDRPLITVTAKNFLGLLQPYLIKYHSGVDGGIDRHYPVDEPLKTLDTSNRLGVCEPYIVRANGGDPMSQVVSVENPLPTIVATWQKLGIATPFLTKYHGNETGAESVDSPLSTLTTKDRLGVVEPYLIRLKNNQDGQSIDDPIQTLTTKNSYALVIPQLGLAMDILFRMLEPHELAAAMSFPKSYSFSGSRANQVKQIGNAVPVNTAKALVKNLIQKL